MMPRTDFSEAPALIESSRESRKYRASGYSSMYPMPPWNCMHVSATSRTNRPAFSLAIDASRV
jgi:hypothetical protein